MVEVFANCNNDLILTNPISSELGHMRPSLISGLVEAYQKNSARNFNDLSFFEIGNIFIDNSLVGQKLMISGLRAGKNKEQNHYHDERFFDVFDVKKDLLNIAEVCGIKNESLQIEQKDLPKYYHPHRSAVVKLGKNIIGYYGEMHPVAMRKLNVKNTLNLFEVFFDSLPNSTKSIKKGLILNDFPEVERDFAFLFNQDQAVGEIVKSISSCDKLLVKKVEIFDIYQGKNLSDGKKSIAFRVIIQSPEKTLESAEIENLSKKIIEIVTKNHGGVIRS